MKLDTAPPERVVQSIRTARVAVPPVARPPRSRGLLLALILVALAGFLLGLGLPATP